MIYLRIIKRMLLGIFAISLLLTTEIAVQCNEGEYVDFMDLDSYIEYSNKEWEKAGYTSNNGEGSVSTPSQQETTQTQKSPKDTSKKAIDTCEHLYVDSIVIEPTCSESGMMESKCSKCGDTYKVEIPATGIHDYSSEVTKKATCIEKGETTYTCKVCGDSYTEEIDALGHKYNRSVAEDATCTTDGTFVYICEICDDSYTEVIPAAGHVEVEEITKEAGVYTPGKKSVKCSVCGEILSTEAIPAKYPVSNLYVVIACAALALVTGVVITFAKKKYGANKLSKSA